MSGDTFDFFQGNRETLTGTLHLPQTVTPGDVLTVQQDRSIAAAPGGGGASGGVVVRGPFPFAFDTPGIAALVFGITAASPIGSSLTIAGDHTALLESAKSFTVTGSTGNDGTYTVASSTLIAGHTVIVTNEAVPDATADGNVNAQAGGVEVYTPTIGDVLLNAWIEVTDAFDGPSALADIGTFAGDQWADVGGWFNYGNGSVDLTSVWGGHFSTDIFSQIFSPGVDDMLGAGVASGSGGMFPPARFVTASPVVLVVAQSGAAPYYPPIDSTQGAGNVYLVTATPVAF